MRPALVLAARHFPIISRICREVMTGRQEARKALKEWSSLAEAGNAAIDTA